MLSQSWTSSGDEKLDEIIRNTQLEAKGFDSHYYIEWIPYDDLKNIKKIVLQLYIRVNGQMVLDLFQITKDIILEMDV